MALNGVSFTLKRAEIFGLLGPNGSGKTTIFRILSTLMLPTTGRALILGHDVALDPSGVRRQIGVVFQSRSIDLKLSAEENLIHVGHLYGITGSVLKKRVAEMLSASRSRIAPRTVLRPSPEECSAVSNWPRDCCIVLKSCYSMNRPRALIPARVETSGSICKFCATRRV